MSDFLKHECGIAMLRLKKPLEYFHDKYGTALYGFNKLFLLMEKQHNRGHDGVGIGGVKLDVPLGQPYMYRARSARKDSLTGAFDRQMKKFGKLVKKGLVDPDDPATVKRYFDYGGEVLLGHLRYGTSGVFDEGSCHPYLRRSNWETRTLMVAGNFNMANTNELTRMAIARGQHPVFGTDTQTVLEEIGFHLDEEHTDIYRQKRDDGVDGATIPKLISQQLDITTILKRAAEHWDGGYTIAGAVGNGDCFVMRDPNGIRPCFYFDNDEFTGFASERVPLMTVFDLPQEEIQELPRGHAVSIKNTGELKCERFAEERPAAPCSFERIYFSRGNDPDIYTERKNLGAALVPNILKAIDGDLQNTIFNFVPNTAETAYYGMMSGLREHRRNEVKQAILEASKKGELDEKTVDDLVLHNWPRGEKIAHKDIKMRTFISQEKDRKQLVSHVYDITYGIVKEKDNLVIIDDSIVRGTTLRESILQMLSRTNPKKIVIVSTAPQIRYPDCYGIDMAELGKFIAFQATIELLLEDEKNYGKKFIREVSKRCEEEMKKPPGEMRNCVQDIYDPFSPEEISARIAAMVKPQGTRWKGEVEVIYIGIDALKKSIAENCGDWYFTGIYPTPAGYSVVNQAFLHYYNNVQGRPYDMLF
ncbi:MAG: amidophosphoribosyltransferase [Verrucomicrobiales bacterium]|jgi:amidophosphoribosyltransferase